MSLYQIVTNKIIKQNDIQRRHEFQKYLSLWDWQGSDVSACYEFKLSVAPNSSWIILCAKRNLRYIKPNRYSTVQLNCTVSIFVKLSDRPVVFTFTFSERRYIKLGVWRVHTIVNDWNSKYIQYLIDSSLASITAAILLGIDWKSFSRMTQSTSLQSFLISFSNSKYFVIWPFFLCKQAFIRAQLCSMELRSGL